MDGLSSFCSSNPKRDGFNRPLSYNLMQFVPTTSNTPWNTPTLPFKIVICNFKHGSYDCLSGFGIQ